MRRLGLVALLVIVLVAVGGVGCESPEPDGVDGALLISGVEFAFEPASLSIPLGQESVIRFANVGTVDHDIISEELGFASGTVRIGAEVFIAITPQVAGTYTVICSIPGHQEAGMVGAITVN